MTGRPKGERAGSGFNAGAHVEVELTCPSNHLIARVGRNLDPRADQDMYFTQPMLPPDERGVRKTKTWVKWDADTDPSGGTLRCLTCGTEDRYRVDEIRAVLDRLHARGVPVDLRLTKARFDDVAARLNRR